MYKYTRIFEKVSDERKSKNIVRKEKRQSTRKQYTVNCFLYWFTIRMFRMPFVPNIVFFPFYSFLVNFSQRLYVFSVVFFLFCIKSVVVCVWLRCCVQRWMRRIFFFSFLSICFIYYFVNVICLLVWLFVLLFFAKIYIEKKSRLYAIPFETIWNWLLYNVTRYILRTYLVRTLRTKVYYVFLFSFFFLFCYFFRFAPHTPYKNEIIINIKTTKNYINETFVTVFLFLSLLI